MQQLKKIAIGIGTNLGNREDNIRNAVQRLKEDVFESSVCSPLYETEPWGILDQPRFINAVIVGASEWKPPALLNFLKSLERELGRTTTVKNGPRIIDLDLLVYEDEIWEEDGLRVPHAGIAEREFVLLPLRDVWADWKHPLLQRTTSELLEQYQRTAPLTSKVLGPLPLSTESQ